jgi:hypothetical protein
MHPKHAHSPPSGTQSRNGLMALRSQVWRADAPVAAICQSKTPEHTREGRKRRRRSGARRALARQWTCPIGSSHQKDRRGGRSLCVLKTQAGLSSTRWGAMRARRPHSRTLTQCRHGRAPSRARDPVLSQAMSGRSCATRLPCPMFQMDCQTSKSVARSATGAPRSSYRERRDPP